MLIPLEKSTELFLKYLSHVEIQSFSVLELRIKNQLTDCLEIGRALPSSGTVRSSNRASGERVPL